MWECQKCHEQHEDSFEVCWNCGTSKEGVEDPTFQAADQVDPAFLEQTGSQRVNEVGITAVPPAPTAVYQSEADAYEFTPGQIEVIRSLSWYMQIVGVVSVISGGILVVAGLVLVAKGGASSLLQGVVALIIGAVTMQAAGAFRNIVDSRENHLRHLMTALSTLRSLYKLQVILLGIALGLLVLVMCLVAVSAR